MFESFLPAMFEWWHLPFLFAATLIAESFGALIGGGSLVMLPAVLLTGTPLTSAIAIDNATALGTEAGIISEAHQNIRKHWKLVIFMLFPVVSGGILGTYLLLNSSTGVIRPIMIAAVLYLLFHSFILSKRISPKKLNAIKYPLLFVLLFIIGAYNNFIGVGEGTFAKLAVMLVLGMTFIQSHGIKTMATVPIRLYSLVVTGFAGLIIWPYVLTMWIAAFIAGKYSTKYIKKVPESALRPAMTLIAIGFVTYLIFFA